MATIYDVARVAGVSPKTVSRVLNGDGAVRAETRAAVEAAMRGLAYVPSSAARMMRSSRSGLVGLVTGAITTSAEPVPNIGLPDLLIVQGIQNVLAAAGLTLMIADTGGRADRVPALLQTFLEHRVEGLIYVADRLMRVALPGTPSRTPLVLANCDDEVGTPAVMPDDRRGQEMLTARLVAAGHRRIGFLTLRASAAATPLRLQGYHDALARAGIAADAALVQPCNLEAGDGEAALLWDALDAMLRLPDPPTVLMCGNDRMALRVYGLLRSRGVRVPEDISVAGYDNHRAIAETLYPPLTTVELPYAAIGARAAEMLLRLIDGSGLGEASRILISGPLHWRESVTERRAGRAGHLRTVDSQL